MIEGKEGTLSEETMNLLPTEEMPVQETEEEEDSISFLREPIVETIAFSGSDEEIAAAAEEKVDPQPEVQLQQETPKPADKKKGRPATPRGSSAPTTVDTDGMIAKCMDLIQQKLDKTQQIGWIADKATKWNLDADGSKLKQMSVDQLQSCIDELSAKPTLKQ